MRRLVMAILGGVKGPDHRLRCPAGLVQKLSGTSGPARSKGAWRCGLGGLESALRAKSAEHGEGHLFGVSYRFFAWPPVCPGPAVIGGFPHSFTDPARGGPGQVFGFINDFFLPPAQPKHCVR